MIPLCSIGVPFLALSESAWLAAAGLALYGIVLGTHETVMRSAIADLTVFRKRGTAYGIFNVVYGLGFFAGQRVSWAFSTIIGARRESGLASWSSKPQPSCSSSDSTGGRSDAPPVLMLKGSERPECEIPRSTTHMQRGRVRNMSEPGRRLRFRSGNRARPIQCG